MRGLAPNYLSSRFNSVKECVIFSSQVKDDFQSVLPILEFVVNRKIKSDLSVKESVIFSSHVKDDFQSVLPILEFVVSCKTAQNVNILQLFT